jgi:hypothetical protein
MPCQPSAPSAVPLPPACAPLPGEVVPCAFRPKSPSIRIQPLASQIQPFAAKRLDDSRPLDTARAQRRLQIWRISQSNRLIVFCRNVSRPGEQTTSTKSSARPHGARAAAPRVASKLRVTDGVTLPQIFALPAPAGPPSSGLWIRGQARSAVPLSTGPGRLTSQVVAPQLGAGGSDLTPQGAGAAARMRGRQPGRRVGS